MNSPVSTVGRRPTHHSTGSTQKTAQAGEVRRYAFGVSMHRFYLLAYLVLFLPGICLAELKDENLWLSLPDGYKVDFQRKEEKMITIEMVPQGESVKNWTEMLTTQILLGRGYVTPEKTQDSMKALHLSACKTGTVFPVTKGKENGYAFSIWISSCPLSPVTGKMETTFYKAIQGNDSLYIIHKAFTFDPSKEQTVQWMKYFRSVVVCDSRLADRPCPKVSKSAQGA